MRRILRLALIYLLALGSLGFGIWWLVVDHRTEDERRQDYCEYLFQNDAVASEANKVWGSQRESKGPEYLERSEWLSSKDVELIEFYDISEPLQLEAYSKGWDDICYEPELLFEQYQLDEPLLNPKESIIEE